MGTLTFSQLQAEVRAGLGNRTDLDTRLPSIVNLAQQRIALIHDFDEMEVILNTSVSNTSSANDKNLVLPLKREIYSVVVLNGAQSLKMTYRTPQYWDRVMSMPEFWARDMPRDYTIWNNTLEMFPLPDITYSLRIRYTQWPAALVNSTDLSAYINKDEVIIELALGYALYSLGKEADARLHEGRAMQILMAAAGTDDEKPDMKILPGKSDSDISLTQVGAPWLNAFVRSTD